MRRAEEEPGELTVRSYLGLAGLAFLALAAAILFSGGIDGDPDVSTTTDVTPAIARITAPAGASTLSTAPADTQPPAQSTSAPSPPAGTAAPIPTAAPWPPTEGAAPERTAPSNRQSPTVGIGTAPVQSSSPPAPTEPPTTTTEAATTTGAGTSSTASLAFIGEPCPIPGALGRTVGAVPCVCTAGVWQLA